MDRPKQRAWKKTPRQRARLDEVDADIWVLTESHVAVGPGEGYHGAHTPPFPRRRPDPDERYVSIWSRWPMEPAGPAPHGRGSLAVRVDTPLGPLVVYGTVLAYDGDLGPDPDSPLPRWEYHRQEIARQGEEWRSLREMHPDAGLVVAGDMNQHLDGVGPYGRHLGEELLATAEGAGIRLQTGADVLAAGAVTTKRPVDHIFVSADWCDRLEVTPTWWDLRDDTGFALSDHHTVAVDISDIDGNVGP